MKPLTFSVPISPALVKAIENDQEIARWFEAMLDQALDAEMAEWVAEAEAKLLDGDPDAPKPAGLMRWDGEE
jgi:hypothetical protein